MELTRDNYYTPEADREYMSCSQYQDFLRCEAATMAKMEGRYVPSPSEALIVGNYFHTAMESDEAHQAFIDEHMADIFKMQTSKTTGETMITGKYAPYVKADEMLQTCFNDPLIMSIVNAPGENEVIMTGELFGMKWKIRLDKYCKETRTIIDWKTAADLTKTEYDPATGGRVCFLESLGYLMRAAVYSEIEKQNAHSDEDPAFVIVAVSKQDPPDKGAYMLNSRQRYDYELEQVQKNIVKRIYLVKNHMTPPRRCGSCEYCRQTKKLKKIIPYYVLNPGFADQREEEYDDIRSEDLENAQDQGR